MRAKNFAEILEEQMKKSNIGPTASATPRKAFEGEPAYLAYLIGQIPKTETGPLHYPTVAQKRDLFIVKATPPAHLTEAEKEAWSYFADCGENLGPNIIKENVKSAFRRLALKIHPDQNHRSGASEKFMKLQKSFQTLYCMGR